MTELEINGLTAVGGGVHNSLSFQPRTDPEGYQVSLYINNLKSLLPSSRKHLPPPHLPYFAPGPFQVRRLHPLLDHFRILYNRVAVSVSLLINRRLATPQRCLL